MARQRVRQRATIGVLGKAITRRARSRCELCEARDDLRLFELDPFPAEPDEGRVLLLCGRCRDWLENERIEPVEAHFLTGAVWSELAVVRRAAGRMLLAGDDGEDVWIADALEACNIDPATRELRAEALS